MSLGGLLWVHLISAAAATLLFWTAALLSKGGAAHRFVGHWFARAVVMTAITGAIMATARLAVPALIAPDVPPDQLAQARAVERQTMWLVLYVLLILVTPVQHGLAVVRAGAQPAAVRSRGHAVLTFLAMVASVALIPAALLWERWTFLIVAPIGLVVGVRQLSYASRRQATRAEWEAEHLTSLITAGVTLHTALFVFGTTRTMGWRPAGLVSLMPWVLPALVGLPIIVWLRQRSPQLAKPRR